MFGIETSILFIVTISLAYFIINRWKHQRFYTLVKNLPGHDGFSLFESLCLVLTISKKDYLKVILKYIKEDTPITKIWVANKFVVVTKDAEIINKIFNTPFTQDKPYSLYQSFMARRGLITLNGHDYKKHRKIFVNAFKPKMLELLHKVVEEKADKILSNMKEQVGSDKEFDAMHYVSLFTLETIGKSNFNYDGDYAGTEVYKELERFTTLSADVLPYLFLGLSIKMLSKTIIRSKINKIYSAFENHLEEVKDMHKKCSKNFENTFINSLLDPRNGFDKENLFDEFMTLMIASFETSAKVLSTTLMLLGIHKDVQEKLVQEVDEICKLESDTAGFSSDFLQKFTFMDAVLKESMRLFTVGPVIAREATEEVDLNGYLIPKGTILVLSLDGMHRNPKYWGSDAELFKPERFLEDLKHPNAFAPFSGGSRMCIGYRYAMMSMKIFLIKFLRTYKVESSLKLSEIETEMTMTLGIIGGYKISIQNR